MAWVLLAGLPALASSGGSPTGAPEAASKPGATAERAEHGLTQQAGEIGNFEAPSGPFPITNSMVVSWIVAAGLILFAQGATRRMKDVPGGAERFGMDGREPLRFCSRGSSGRTW